jgi:hypothetical protein
MKEKYKFNDKIINNILELEDDKKIEDCYYIYNDLELNELEEKSVDFLKEYLINSI